MKINKLFLGLAAFSLLFASSCDDGNRDYEVKSPIVAEDCAAVRFATDNEQEYELNPATDPAFDVTVLRSATDEATYNISVLRNDENAYIVPETVSFKSGATSTILHVALDPTAPTHKELVLEISVDAADSNPYLDAAPTYSATVTLIKWNVIGTGQWLDGFWYGFADEVLIQQLDDDPSQYRVSNPYTNEMCEAFEETVHGTYTNWLYFNVTADSLVTWNKNFAINTMYEEGGEYTEILAWYPSALNASQAAYDAFSYVEYAEDGTIAYFQIAPYWYMEGLGGWGPKNGYNCYLAFPGTDLITEWDW